MWLPQSLRKKLKHKKNRERKSTISISKNTKDMWKLPQYEQHPRDLKNVQNEITARVPPEPDILSYIPFKLIINQQTKIIIVAGACA